MEKLIEECPPQKWDGSNGKTIIKVIGVGGAGGNAVNTMISRMSETEVEFIAANTDQQALAQSLAPVKIPLGSTGLGAGARPEVGFQAANEARDLIAEKLRGATMLFITAGMGGGTGTGASPVIAEVAQELGILTVAVVTRPFTFEGARRMRVAEQGLKYLKNRVHSLIVIMNDKLEEILGEDATFEACFEKADEVLYNACGGIAEVIERVGQINLDFNDVRTVMAARGTAMMGSGEASGPDRAINAASQAIYSPLLEGAKLKGARGLLVNVTAARSMRMAEYRTALETVKNYADPEATVISGMVYDDSMEDRLRVTVIATGLDQEGTDDTFVKPMVQEPEDNGSRLWNPSGSSGPFGMPSPAPRALDNDLFGSPFIDQKKNRQKAKTPTPKVESTVSDAKPEQQISENTNTFANPTKNNLFGQGPSQRASAPEESGTRQTPENLVFGTAGNRPASDVFAALKPQEGKNSGLWTSAAPKVPVEEPSRREEEKPAEPSEKPSFESGIPNFLRKKN